METFTYRGIITRLEDTRFEIRQVYGHDYGHQSIVFRFDKSTKTTGTALAEGSFAEVLTDPVFTRSLPPQGYALSVHVLSPLGESIVVNGTIKGVETTPQGWRLSITTLKSETPQDKEIILIVPQNALKGIKAGGLSLGREVSAVTKGMAALSLPAQMPVHVLLPYNVNTQTV